MLKYFFDGIRNPLSDVVFRGILNLRNFEHVCFTKNNMTKKYFSIAHNKDENQ